LTVFYTRFIVDFGDAFIKSEKGMARYILFCDLCLTLNKTFYWDFGQLECGALSLDKWFLMSARNRLL